jgi:uncharacterized membrane protein YjgN (DUF898 family)
MTMESPDSPLSTTERSSVREFRFHKSGGSLFGIHVVNLFLALVTLGIYSFWAVSKFESTW